MSCYINSGKRGCSRAVRRFVASPAECFAAGITSGRFLLRTACRRTNSWGLSSKPCRQANGWGPGISIDASLLVGLVVASRNSRVLSVTEFSVTVRLEWGRGVLRQHDDDATSRGPLSHSSSSPHATHSLSLGPPKGNEHTVARASRAHMTRMAWYAPAGHGAYRQTMRTL